MLYYWHLWTQQTDEKSCLFIPRKILFITHITGWICNLPIIHYHRYSRIGFISLDKWNLPVTSTRDFTGNTAHKRVLPKSYGILTTAEYKIWASFTVTNVQVSVLYDWINRISQSWRYHKHGTAFLIKANIQPMSYWIYSWGPFYWHAGFPQLLKNHWNSDLFQDHGKIIEFHEKFLKFVKN